MYANRLSVVPLGVPVLTIALWLLALAGCGAPAREAWTKPNAPPMNRVAVLPFENQTAAPRAGTVASELVVSELVGAGASVLEPTEALDLLRRDNIDPGDAAKLPSAQRLGRILQVSHVLQGSVLEYRYKPGFYETPVVGVTARVVEVASGEIVWTGSYARSGSTWFREDGLAFVTQGIVRDMVANLTSTLGSRGR
jgi:TolB-like protein